MEKYGDLLWMIMDILVDYHCGYWQELTDSDKASDSQNHFECEASPQPSYIKLSQS